MRLRLRVGGFRSEEIAAWPGAASSPAPWFGLPVINVGDQQSGPKRDGR